MTKELESFNRIEQEVDGCMYIYHIEENDISIVKKSLLELQAIKEAKPSEALECLEYLADFTLDVDILLGNTKAFPKIKQALLKAQEQEKENEILKEIIKIFFDRGCPLHQYINKEGILTIEVDNECSTIQLGEFKGVDLNKKLKEVLE